MKKILVIFFLSLLVTSCSSNDDLRQEQQDRGSIEMEFNGEKLSFGKNAYNGWLLNNQEDTIARFYTARINIDDINFYDIKLYTYLSENNSIETIKMQFIPAINGDGWTYQYTTEEKTMVYKNIEFDGKWLKGDFEGYLFFHPIEDQNPVHLTNGKINIPIKGLDIDWSQW